MPECDASLAPAPDDPPWRQLTLDELLDDMSEYMAEMDRREAVRALMERAALGAFRKWQRAARPPGT